MKLPSCTKVSLFVRRKCVCFFCLKILNIIDNIYVNEQITMPFEFFLRKDLSLSQKFRKDFSKVQRTCCIRMKYANCGAPRMRGAAYRGMRTFGINFRLNEFREFIARSRDNVSRIPPPRVTQFFVRNCYNYVELRWRSACGAITWLPLISAVQYGHLILCKIMEMSNYARWLNYKRLSRNWVNLNCGINGYLTRFRLVESRADATTLRK